MSSLLPRLIMGIILLSLAAGINSADSQKEPFHIGAIYNLQGAQSSLDIPSSQGAMLAVQEINKEGGVNGREIILDLIDGKTDRDKIQEAAVDLTHMHLPVIIGMSDTDMVIPAARIAAGNQTLFITSGATSPQLVSEIPQYLYLSCFADNAQAAVAAEYAYNNLTARKAGVILDEKSEYARLLAQYFSERFTELGGTILYQKPDLHDLPDEKPDILFIASGPEQGIQMVQNARNIYPATPIFGGDAYDNAEMVRSTENSSGDLYVTTHVWLNGNASNSTERFKQAYEERYGLKPDAFAGLGYDAVYVTAWAIRNGGDGEMTSDDLIHSLHSMPIYPGVTGNISYQGGEIPNKTVTLIKIREGQPVYLGDYYPEKIPEP